VTPDPRPIIQALGIDPAAIRLVDTLSERHGHLIWRIVTPERSYILKWLPEAEASVEIKAYSLLQRLGVPTLPLYGHTAQALLLEDLAWSDKWRLAVQADSAKSQVGRAVARWYRVFHQAGEALLRVPLAAGLLAQGDCPGFLKSETDELDPASILATGRALALADHPVWDLAANHIELLKAAVNRQSLTLNYNDFHWTNLALSHQEGDQQEAIIFDYHLLGVGMRYSDCRNVAGSLSGDAVVAFWAAYGHVDPREEKLDRPLATLYALHVASGPAGAGRSTSLSEFPKWAEESRQRVINGCLERDLVAAIQLAQSSG